MEARASVLETDLVSAEGSKGRRGASGVVADRRVGWAGRVSRSAPWVVLLLAPAVVLRVWNLTALGYNSDEAVYAGQAASLAHDPNLTPYFPVFRAHPLLFQSVLSVLYRIFGFSEAAGRLLSVAFGLGMVAAVYVLGRMLYGTRVGYIAALISAVMPYQVVVSRQVLLDGPMATMATISICIVARYVQTRRPMWLYAAAATLGLTILMKETSILLLGGVYAFFALTPTVRLKLRQIVLATAILAAVVLVYPATVALAGARTTGGNFLVWQLLRRSNHSWTFYPTVLPSALGYLVVALAVLGLWFLRKRGTWRESLLVWWVVGPVLFFEVWSVKGFQYLLPIAAPMAVLAARSLVALGQKIAELEIGGRFLRQATAIATCIVVVALGWQSWNAIKPGRSGGSFLAGSGGVPGGREAGQFVAANIPANAQILALGPSMANIIEFYGHRTAYGLSVSPNPLHRNPVYASVQNPDLSIRHNDLQFIVWDSYSASRSKFFSDRLLGYVQRYHGHVVNTQYVTVTHGSKSVRQPVIVIYQVRP